VDRFSSNLWLDCFSSLTSLYCTVSESPSLWFSACVSFSCSCSDETSNRPVCTMYTQQLPGVLHSSITQRTTSENQTHSYTNYSTVKRLQSSISAEICIQCKNQLMPDLQQAARPVNIKTNKDPKMQTNYVWQYNITNALLIICSTSIHGLEAQQRERLSPVQYVWLI